MDIDAQYRRMVMYMQPFPANGQNSGAIMALIALAFGVGLVALVDFVGIAGQGIKVGQFILALAPWVLAMRTSSHRGRPLEGAVAFGWVVLFAGAIGLSFAHDAGEALPIAAAAVQAAGAVLILGVLQQSGHFGMGTLVRYLILGGGLGAFLVFTSLYLGDSSSAELVAIYLVSAYLIPQLAHDFAVVVWGYRTGEWQRVRASLEGVGTSFILWTIAGHLIIAPAILYWSPKPQVVLGGLGAGVALLLFAVRGVAGVFSLGTVLMVTGVTILYGLGLAFLIRGQRPY